MAFHREPRECSAHHSKASCRLRKIDGSMGLEHARLDEDQHQIGVRDYCYYHWGTFLAPPRRMSWGLGPGLRGRGGVQDGAFYKS